MSGDNQHFIPRLYLKGFKVRGIAGGKQAWVFRKAGDPELLPIKEIAAGWHFYSPPDPGSLDDTITKYENRLARHFEGLRKLPAGPIADAGTPAEIIAHLTVRTESMRTGFTFALKHFVMKAFQTFQDKELLRQIMRLDGDAPDERFKTLTADSLKQYEKNLEAIGLSHQAAERIAFVLSRERFPQLIADAKPKIELMSAYLYHNVDSMMAAAQRKALGQSLVPEERANFLKSLQWQIMPSDGPAILPDCVSIALQADGTALPLLLADADKIATVVMPLDHRRLIVGNKEAASEFWPFLYNMQAQACSENFVVASGRTAKLESQAQYIGVMPQSTMLEFVRDTFTEYKLHEPPPLRQASGPYPISLNFRDGTSKEAAEAAAEKVRSVLSYAASHFSLDRIEQITFTSNVSEFAATIDRGVTDGLASPDMEPASSKIVSVLRDDKVCVHVILENGIAQALIDGQEAPGWSGAIWHFLFQLAEGYCAVEFDKSFPGIMLRPHLSAFNSTRYEPVSTAWTTYVSSRFSGPFWPEGIAVKKRVLTEVIGQLRTEAPEMAKTFFDHRDHRRLVMDFLFFIQRILVQSAALAGLADAVGVDILEDEEAAEIFRSFNMADWYPNYVRDLRTIWDRRGQWRSEKDFMSLSQHTERLLWQCGMVLTEGPDGQCRVEFPNVSAVQQSPKGRE